MQLNEKLFFKNYACNIMYRSVDKLPLLLLFPIFEIKNASAFGDSALYKIISCGKDIFYRMLNELSIDWEYFCYSLNM
jgi:hypothetical protein